ncbi:MAG: YciI family protein [Planctomycetota bacterium]|jgi:uncharacterized protein YciI
MKRFICFYTLKPELKRTQGAVGQHIAYWESLTGRDVRGGTFDNLSGGLMCFDANDAREAQAVVEEDPFFLEGLFKDVQVLEWVIVSS